MKKTIIIVLCLIGFALAIGLYIQHEESQKIREAKWKKEMLAELAEQERLIEVDTLLKWRKLNDDDKKKILKMRLESYLPMFHSLHGFKLDGYIPAIQFCLESSLPQFSSTMPIEKAVSWVAYSGCNGSIEPITKLSPDRSDR